MLFRRGRTLTYTDSRFGENYSENWTYRGNGFGVRGQFKLVRMADSYTIRDARAKAAKVPGLYLATTYELEHYAKYLWNGKTTVVAFGSLFRKPGVSLVPYLWGTGGLQRELELNAIGYLWPKADRVLCVQR